MKRTSSPTYASLSGDLAQDLYSHIVKDDRIWREEPETSLQLVTEYLAEKLKVGRVSVWDFSGDGTLECLDVCDTDQGIHKRGRQLLSAQCSHYFSSVENSRIIDAHDAYTDPRTTELTEAYLKPNRIGAMLNATIRAGGDIRGVLCLENTGGARLWTKKEKAALLSVADLLAQLLMHHSLKQTVDRYESLLSNMPSAAFRCRCDGLWTVDYVSAGIRSITGYLSDEFFGANALNFPHFIHPDDKDRVLKEMAESVADSQRFDLEYRILHRSGDVRWVRQYGRAYTDNNAETSCLDGVLSDITEHKSAQALEAQRNEFVLQISEGLSGAVGNVFFQHLTQELAKVLSADYVFVAKLNDQEKGEMQTLAVFSHEKKQANFRYLLADTPCENVFKQGICAYDKGVQKRYPKDRLLQDMMIEAYLGTPLTASDGRVLGVMVVLNCTPLDDLDMAKALLKIFSVRASSELERQLSEQELLTSQSYYQGLFHAAGDAIFMVKEGLIVDCNDAALSLFKMKRSELIGKTPIELSPEIQPDGSWSKNKAVQKIEAASRGETQHFDWMHKTSNGDVFEAEVTLSRVEVDGDVNLLGIVRDVSERKRRDSIIQKQGEQLRASIESLPGIFYMFDQHGKVVHFNKAYLDHVGMSADEALKLNAIEFVHPEDKQRTAQAIRRVMEEGTTEQIELRSISNRGKGPVVHLLATGSRTYLEGKPYLVGAAFDIGERVLAEENLAKSQNALKEYNQNLLILNTLSNSLFGLRKVEDILERALFHLSQLPFSPLVMFMSVENGQDCLRIVKGANIKRSFNLEEIKIPLEGSLAGLAIKQKILQVSEDIANDDRQSTNLISTKQELLGVVSEVSLPLFDRDKPIGCISLMYRQERSFSESEKQTLASMANNIAISITNARYTDRLQFQAQHDSLTGLFNRAALHSRLAKELKEGTGNLALLLVDLDRFKEVNDTLGHDIGDQLICTIGPRVQQVLQGWDVFLSRLGGDEFALLVNCPAGELELYELADLILESIREPMAIEGFTLEINASVGIVYGDRASIKREEILRRADVAMYHAKSTNVGYYLYEPSIDNHSREKLGLISELRAAIECDQFVMHYQPKVDLENGKIVGFESLIRWQHPERGLIFPDGFIHLVEMSDLIHPITQLALRKSLLQLCDWNRNYGTQFTMAVNISTRNLLDSDFANKLKDMFAQLQFDPSLLELEITESTLISDPRRSLETLHAISQLDVKFSIDDFGTGYSSLAYLKQLPIETLKIDRSFVMEMDTNKHDELIVSSTVNLAHNLGMKVVAEGVESQKIQDKLRAMGCDYAQGYHISKPVDAHNTTELIATEKKRYH